MDFTTFQADGGRSCLEKVPTGIGGFDLISRGGLPRHRTTLVCGGSGSGKTMFALQTLSNQTRQCGEPGLFVAFEESSDEVMTNSGNICRTLEDAHNNRFFFFDAHLSVQSVQTGQFDLCGMLAILSARVRESGIRNVVFDGVDVLLTLLSDPVVQMREVYRIREWLKENGLTGILTAKFDARERSSEVPFGFLQFMADCTVQLSHRLEFDVIVRRVQILKYRGSDFSEGEFPMHLSDNGMHVVAPTPVMVNYPAFQDRVSLGFERLDEMLHEGIFRGSTALITGSPGTAKTTLSGAFTSSACQRGERVLFVSFDEGGNAIVRNLRSVGIELGRHVESGLLRIYSGRIEACSSEQHLITLTRLMDEHRPSCMIVDPLSALIKAGGREAARSVSGRFLHMARERGITLLATALVDSDNPQDETSELQISTIADTWIHLSYVVHSGERNRALTIVKSRGSWHSNQVRELILSSSGLTLADVYTAGGEVLMGTLRWERENQERARSEFDRAQFEYRKREIEASEAELRVRIESLQHDLVRKQAELRLISATQNADEQQSREKEEEITRRRFGGNGATHADAYLGRCAGEPKNNQDGVQ